MAEAGSVGGYSINKRKQIVFDDYTDLLTILIVAHDHQCEGVFKGLDPRHLSFIQPDPAVYPSSLLLGEHYKPTFIDHGDTFSTKVYPYVSLTNVKELVDNFHDWDSENKIDRYMNVRIFWFNGELCVSFRKNVTQVQAGSA